MTHRCCLSSDIHICEDQCATSIANLSSILDHENCFKMLPLDFEIIILCFDWFSLFDENKIPHTIKANQQSSSHVGYLPVVFLCIVFFFAFVLAQPCSILLQILPRNKPVCFELFPVISCGHADESTTSRKTKWLFSQAKIQ